MLTIQRSSCKNDSIIPASGMMSRNQIGNPFTGSEVLIAVDKGREPATRKMTFQLTEDKASFSVKDEGLLRVGPKVVLTR